MEAHLKCNKDLLTGLGLKYSPSKSTIHVAYGKVSVLKKLLRKLNDTALSKFKKDVEEESKETHICRAQIRTENKQKESMVTNPYHSNIVKKRELRKLHLASECRHKEKPIYSWELTSAIRHDSPRFVKLLIRITGELGDVYGDKAYSSRKI